MVPQPVRLVRVRATGKRYILLDESGRVVKVKGEVRWVSGLSAGHGADRRYIKGAVEVLPEVDYTEELLLDLLDEGKDG